MADNLKIEMISIDELQEYEMNCKLHPQEQIEQIKKSIEEFGFNDPIAVWHDNEIIEGHGRLLAAQELGIDKVPIIRLDHLTDDERKAYMLVHNKLTMNSGFDTDMLNIELESIDIDMEPYGFEITQDEEQTEIVEDEAPEPPAEPVCKLGDLWQLGNHRTTETAQQAYDILSQICDKLILWGGNYFLDFLPSSDGWLIWDKRGESGIRNTFADGEMAWCSFHTPVRIYHQLWNGMIREGEHEKRVHPTQKPIRMLSEILQDFSKENEVILDVFGGSGSTLIACEQLNRKCYIAELDPRYCDVIIQRWENFTGQKAVLVDD